MNLTPDQSHYVLTSLMSQGTIRASQVQKALRGRDREIAELRERLASLEKLGGRRGGPRRARGRGRSRGDRAASVSRRPRRRKMSPKVRALRRLQGKYMGYVRRLKPPEKARVRTVREKQGIEAAVRLASSLSAKS